MTLATGSFCLKSPAEAQKCWQPSLRSSACLVQSFSTRRGIMVVSRLTHQSSASPGRIHLPRTCCRAQGSSASTRCGQEGRCYVLLESDASMLSVARHASHAGHGHQEAMEQLKQGQGEPLQQEDRNASSARYVLEYEANSENGNFTTDRRLVIL